MFDKFKQLKKAKELQSKLSQEKIEVEKEGTKVVMTGDMKIESITLSSDIEKEKQEKVLEKCINEAMDKMKRMLAQKMSEMGGMGM